MEDDNLVDLPTEIRGVKFAEARLKEIEALQEVIGAPKVGQLASQQLPRHLRRRAVSHNPRRLPKRLRAKHLSERAKSDNNPNQKPKKPSRKHRRRPSNLLSDYSRRSRRIKWLETHIWHAKRFHMADNRWGYKLPDYPNDKGARAFYRAVSTKCVMQDISYLCCLELCGSKEDIVFGLKKVLDEVVAEPSQESITLMRDLNGQVIGSISLVWKKGCSVVWLWIHPAFYDQALDALCKVFELQREEKEAEPTPKKLKMSDHVNEAKLANRNVPFNEKIPKLTSSKITAFELRDTLNRFRLLGPLTTSVLHETLKPATFLDSEGEKSDVWWNTEELQCKSDQDALRIFNKKPRSVQYFVSRDPRYLLPHKRHCVQPVLPEDLTGNDQVSELDFIWNPTIRDCVTATKTPDSQVNAEKSKLLVPGSELPETAKESKIPMMLLHQHDQFGSGWDIILPAGWGMSFWLNFVFRGARVGGQQEMRQLCLEQQKFFPLLDAPESPAGALEMSKEEELLRGLHLRYRIALV